MTRDEQDNVIHVMFGPGGGRRVPPMTDAPSVRPDSTTPPPTFGRPHKPEHVTTRDVTADGGTGSARSLAPEDATSLAKVSDPVASLYTPSDVARLFGLPESKLRYWARSKLIEPTGREGRRRAYTFQDLIEIRTARSLLERGVSLRNVRNAVETLRASLPRVTRPLSELRVVADGDRVVVRGDRGTFDGATGQLLLDFDVSELREDVVKLLRGPTPTSEDRRAAYDLYLEGCRYDEDETTYERADAAYRRAIELDPSLGNAITNLGNLRYRRGFVEEAAKLYERALSVDPEQPEALYNLGFLHYELGNASRAVEWFNRAVEYDPAFADAHFNLAMVLEDVGRRAEARAHWETYLRLDPNGAWAEVARRHLSV